MAGETVIAFVPRHSVTEGDEVAVEATSSPSTSDVKPAYRRWIGEPLPAGDWIAVVEAVHPAQLLDPDSGSSRHVLARGGTGDLVILRVFDQTGGPVLSDETFAARVESIEGALNR